MTQPTPNDQYQPVSSAARQAWIDGEDDPNELRSIDRDNGVSDRTTPSVTPGADKLRSALAHVGEHGFGDDVDSDDIIRQAAEMQLLLGDATVRIYPPDPTEADLGPMYVLDALGVSMLVRQRFDGLYVHVDRDATSAVPDGFPDDQGLIVEVNNSGENTYF